MWYLRAPDCCCILVKSQPFNKGPYSMRLSVGMCFGINVGRKLSPVLRTVWACKHFESCVILEILMYFCIFPLMSPEHCWL